MNARFTPPSPTSTPERSLGLQVVEEGVETQTQLANLRACGCDEVQGYLIGKPMTGAQLESLLRNQAVRRLGRAA